MFDRLKRIFAPSEPYYESAMPPYMPHHDDPIWDKITAGAINAEKLRAGAHTHESLHGSAEPGDLSGSIPADKIGNTDTITAPGTNQRVIDAAIEDRIRAAMSEFTDAIKTARANGLHVEIHVDRPIMTSRGEDPENMTRLRVFTQRNLTPKEDRNESGSDRCRTSGL